MYHSIYRVNLPSLSRWLKSMGSVTSALFTNSPQTHSAGNDRLHSHSTQFHFNVDRTVIGGDGRVRREMRFRTPSATRGEESAARGANGAADAAKFRRQQSEPMGHPPTPPSGRWKINSEFLDSDIHRCWPFPRLGLVPSLISYFWLLTFK
jgi:hypothetical protein